MEKKLSGYRNFCQVKTGLHCQQITLSVVTGVISFHVYSPQQLATVVPTNAGNGEL